MSAGWKERAKMRDLKQKSKPCGKKKKSIQQNIISQKAQKCAKCHKNEVTPKVGPAPSQ